MSRYKYRSRKKGSVRALVFALVILAAAALLFFLLPRIDGGDKVSPLTYRRGDGAVSVHFIDVGQGDAMLIVADDGSAMTIDAGANESESVLTDYISQQKIKRLEYVLFTHNHSDHTGGGDKLLSRFEVGAVLFNGYGGSTVSYDNLVSAADKKNIPCYTLSVGDEFTLGSVKLTVLGPVRPDYGDDNDSSIVIKLSYGDTSAVFMGDCGKQAEEDMLSLWGEDMFACDVIKIGHHGSSGSTGEELIKAAGPAYAVISCGRGNDYGHPHASVLKLLEKYSVTVLRTDINENIIFESDGKVIEPVT